MPYGALQWGHGLLPWMTGSPPTPRTWQTSFN